VVGAELQSESVPYAGTLSAQSAAGTGRMLSISVHAIASRCFPYLMGRQKMGGPIASTHALRSSQSPSVTTPAPSL
jgi:hypothetical protein